MSKNTRLVLANKNGDYSLKIVCIFIKSLFKSKISLDFVCMTGALLYILSIYLLYRFYHNTYKIVTFEFHKLIINMREKIVLISKFHKNIATIVILILKVYKNIGIFNFDSA